MKIRATRYHDFSTGHRVYGHESKCAHLHGHNYRIHFTIEADQLDTVGRVLDFSCIKDIFCNWLEDNWDHKFLIWEKDVWADVLTKTDPEGVVVVPFNPTAENMAQFLLTKDWPVDASIKLIAVSIEETRKCAASAEL
jgi:6-pyruvoyltetrahydropterin/6-carboxytetrahydropterin synthase